jgi:hypothetical protein
MPRDGQAGGIVFMLDKDTLNSSIANRIGIFDLLGGLRTRRL